MYSLIVGEGGCSPEYFMTKMTLREAQDYAEGLWRRSRSSWEQIRLLANIVSRCHGAKKDIEMQFPWETDTRGEEQHLTKNDIAALRKRASDMERMLNNRNKKK